MISDETVIGYAEWNESEAKSLRLYRADSPSMPELANMHEETAAALRTLLKERNELATSCGHCGDLERAFQQLHNVEAERDQLRENIKLLDGLWHEYHDAYVLQVEENDRLKNDLEAAIMDADMQAREAGNMEYNARVLMTERDEVKADLELQRCCLAVARRDRDRAMAERDQERGDREEWMRQHAALDELCTRREAERDQLREVVEALMAADDYWLRGNKDNQWASMMAAARAKARVALGKDRQ